MPKITKREKAYQNLKTDLEAVLKTGRAKLEASVREHTVQTHWRIGQRLAQSLGDTDKTQASEIITRLASDLNVDKTVIYRSLKFFRTYPEGTLQSQELKRLSWGAITEILPVDDPGKRQFYLDQAAKERWGRDALKRAIKARLFDEHADRKGKTKVPSIPRPSPGLHVYEAKVERVVDGDTLIVRLDLGFDVLKRQRIRLRSLDAPDLKTPAGTKAKRFVERAMKGAKTVVLKTYWHDKYGRYVADLLYDNTSSNKDVVFRSGRFLNRELVDKRLAKPVL